MSAAFDELGRSRPAQRQLLGSLKSLVRGLVTPASSPSPRAAEVYERLIGEKLARYEGLRESVAGVLYLRHRLEGDVQERRAEIARLHDAARREAGDGDEDRALWLLERKHRLLADLSEMEEQLGVTRRDAEEATRHLLGFREEIRALEREKLRSMATLAARDAKDRLREAHERIAALEEGDQLAQIRERVLAAREAESVNRAALELDGPLELDTRHTSARLDLASLKKR